MKNDKKMKGQIMKEYKFTDSKIYKLNEKLKKKPFKYIYKELLPNFLFDKIQREVYFSNQKAIINDWNKVLTDYFENKIEIAKVIPKKKFLNDEKIIWQFWGQGWDYEKLPNVVKICYKAIDKYKENYTLIRLDMKNIGEYLEFPDYVMKKLAEKKMGYAHFTDILRFALLKYYGGVWIDATILLTDYLPREYFEMDYFLFQRDDNFENKKEFELYDSIYFSRNKKSKIKMLSSIIFSHKDNKIMTAMLDLLLVFWRDNDRIPNYFFMQILYTELIEKYYAKDRCKIVSDTLPHELFKVWFDNYSEEKLKKITDSVGIHKLSFKIESSKKKVENTFFEYFKNLYEI